MGTLIVHFRGINAYVPHTDGNALLAVMPNSTRLGQSPPKAPDGTDLPRHLPFFYHQSEDMDGNVHIVQPQPFPGARLTFTIEGQPSPLDLTEIDVLAQQGWLDTDADLLAPQADDRLGGQALLTHGTVTLFETEDPCNKIWAGEGFSESVDLVIPGLTATIENVDTVTVNAETWVGAGTQDFYFLELPEEKPTIFFVGNFCAEDALDWPRNSDANQRSVDFDLRWIYGLSTNAAILDLLSRGEKTPVPEVNGHRVQSDMSSADAFAEFWGPGGGAGCECEGTIDKPQSFT